MANFVLIAEFQVKPESVAAFVPLILANAHASVTTEPGCLQFDVTQQADDPTKFALYEVYADAAAFEAHGKMPHFQQFFAAAKDMIVGRGTRRLTRLAGFHKH
ncbi:MAG TPA: putative quinol monooxygenase [Stellaceae bacterium]|nr:putative quinol monooxygenase [Stellaceae bacterium]